MRVKNYVKLFVVAAMGVSVLTIGGGCASHAAEGAMIGGAAGAGLGAIIGHNSHGRTAEGALIGGAIGAIGGGLIGNEADKRDRYERDRYAYEQGYDDGRYNDGRYSRGGRYYERHDHYHAPPPRSHRDDGYYESYRETKVYRRY